MRPPHTRPLLPLFFVLLAVAGVALIVTFALESTPTAAVNLTIKRDQAGVIAADFIRSQGDDPAARWSTISYSFDSNSQSYLLRETDRERLNERANADLDLAHWNVRFWTPLHPDEWSVAVSSRTGRIVGYSHAIRAEQAGATLPITAAQRLAESALPVSVAQLKLIERVAETQPARVDHRFTWERTDILDNEARYRYTVRVQGDVVGAVDEYYWLPESWWREGAWQARRGALLSTVGWTLTYALTALIGFTWLLEARRGRLRRRWAITLFGAVVVLGFLVMLNSISLDLASYNVNDSLAVHIGRQIGGYLTQLGTIGATIMLAGMAGEALVWHRTNGAISLSNTVTRRGLVSRPVVQALLIGGLVGVAQLGFVSAFYALGGRWFGVWSPVTALYDDTLSTPFPAVYALAVGLLPAVGEELLFRLGGISVLTRWTGKPKLAVFFTAIVWASLHATYPQRPFFIRMLELSLVGIGFGFLFLRYGVLASMAAHFTYNASLYVPLFWGGSVWYLISGVLAAGAVLLLLVPAFVRWLRGIPLEPDTTLASPLPAVIPEPLIEPVPIVRRSQWRWLALGSLAATLALLVVGWNVAPPLPRDHTRTSIIAVAQAAAAQVGVDVRGLFPSVQPAADWVDLDLAYLYDELDQTQAAVAVRSGQARAWTVRWSAWDRPDSWQADLGPRGELLAFRRTLPEDAAGATVPISTAQTLATAALAGRVDLAQYELLDAGSAQRSARTDHTFTWQTRQPVIGQAYRRVVVEVQGDRVSSYTPSLYTPPDYRRERSQTTFLGSLGPQVQGALRDIPTMLLPLVGLIGVLRRRVRIRPWALLGLAAGCIMLGLAILRITAAQWAEPPRLILALSWGLGDAVLSGGQLALLGAGAATIWQSRLRKAESRKQKADAAIGAGLSAIGDRPTAESRKQKAEDRESLIPDHRSPTPDSLYTGFLLLPFGVLWAMARAWPAAKPGLFTVPASLASATPALDIIGRAVLAATTNTLLLVGAYGGVVWLLRRTSLFEQRAGLSQRIALAVVTFGMLVSVINLREPTHWLAALLAWPLALWLGREVRDNLLALWWALLAGRLVLGGVALFGTAGPSWVALNGGVLIVGLAGLAGWTLGRWWQDYGAMLSRSDKRLSDK